MLSAYDVGLHNRPTNDIKYPYLEKNTQKPR